MWVVAAIMLTRESSPKPTAKRILPHAFWPAFAPNNRENNHNHTTRVAKAIIDNDEDLPDEEKIFPVPRKQNHNTTIRKPY